LKIRKRVTVPHVSEAIPQPSRFEIAPLALVAARQAEAPQKRFFLDVSGRPPSERQLKTRVRFGA